MTTQLAKELMSGLKENVDELADSFKKMAILGNREEKKEETAPAATESTPPPQTEIITTPAVIVPLQPNIQTTKANGKNHDTGQLSLFDLVA